MKRILYIEDDVDIGQWVKEDLEKRGYSVDWIISGVDAVERVVQAQRATTSRLDSIRTAPS